MPIIKPVSAANGVTLSYHRVARLESDLGTDQLSVSVNSYFNEDAAVSNLPVAWQWRVILPSASVLNADSLLHGVEHSLTVYADSPFIAGYVVNDGTQTLDAMKARKRAEITQARLTADSDYFVYNGKAIRTADKDMFDLLIADSRMSKGLPANWPGGWKAVDDTYVPITSIAEWDAFFVAMYDTGVANFRRSQQLKTMLAEATTPEEVAAIKWETPIG